MLIYLNQRFLSQVPEVIDSHKMMTANSEIIPKLNKGNSVLTSFYIKKPEESSHYSKKSAMKWN